MQNWVGTNLFHRQSGFVEHRGVVVEILAVIPHQLHVTLQSEQRRIHNFESWSLEIRINPMGTTHAERHSLARSDLEICQVFVLPGVKLLTNRRQSHGLLNVLVIHGQFFFRDEFMEHLSLVFAAIPVFVHSLALIVCSMTQAVHVLVDFLPKVHQDGLQRLLLHRLLSFGSLRDRRG